MYKLKFYRDKYLKYKNKYLLKKTNYSTLNKKLTKSLSSINSSITINSFSSNYDSTQHSILSQTSFN